MLAYYSAQDDVRNKCTIYSNYIDDRLRTVITRWRLSNHKLLIETGRYLVPPIPRNDRVCANCNILEDEEHVIFYCPLFYDVRRKYIHTLNKYDTIMKLFNPELLDIPFVAGLLSDIDSTLANR